MKPWLPPDCSIRQALDVWSELEAAYYEENLFGGDTAEIYAYTLMPFSPIAHHSPPWAGAATEVQIVAGRNLHAILTLFLAEHACTVTIEDRKFGRWLAREPFAHRLRVRVTRKGGS